MRKKIKISFLLLLSFIGLVFVSCELQEDAIHQHEHNSNLKLYEMKFEELMTNKKFVNSFSKLPKSKKSIANATFGRTVMEDEYGFTIANKPAKVIENNGETSYTFLITRDSTISDSFENLVIQTDSSNTTKAVIIKYNLTSPITTTEDNSYSFSSNSEITPIVYNDTQVSESSKIIIICYWITTTYCNNDGSGGIGAEHVAGPKCTYKYNRSTYHCTAGDDGTMDDIPSGGGGGSDGGGGGSTTGTGSNYDGSDTSIHGNGSNSLNTAPVPPEFEGELAPEDPCNELKKIGQNSEVALALKKTREYAQESAIEKGYSIKKNSTFNTYAVQYPQNIGNATSIKIKFAGNQYGSIHCHAVTSMYMFSGTDINGLYELSQTYLSSSDPSASIDLFVNIMVTPEYDYAIKIDNPTKLATIASKFSTPKKALKFNNRLMEIYARLSGTTQGNAVTLEKIFLDFIDSSHDYFVDIGNYDFGISLYRRDNSTMSTQNNNWFKLELDEFGTVTPIPCN